MIRSFVNKLTEDLFNGLRTSTTRRFPPELCQAARRKLQYLNAAEKLRDLLVPLGNRLEALKGDLKGFHSIRVNDQWRIVFRWGQDGPDAVTIVDYH